MDRSESQSAARQFSLFDPPVLTLIVYGGLLLLAVAGELNSPLGRLLLIPGVLGIILVPIFTLRSLGQALTSIYGGGTLMRFTSGVLRIEREGDRLAAGFNHRWRHYAGGGITAPGESTDLRRWVRWREIGSFLGLVVYAVLILSLTPVIQSLPGIAGDTELENLVATSVFALMVLTVTLAVWQLINRQMPRIWRMWRGDESADRQAAMIGMTSYLLADRRPRDWPAAWPETAARDDDGAVEGLYGYRFAYLHALDSGDLQGADRCFRYLEDHADRLRSRQRAQLVDLEAAFVEAWIRGDAERARELLDGLDDPMVESYRYRRVQSAVLLAEGDWHAARQHAAEGLDAAAPKLNDGEVRAEAAIMEEVLRRTEDLAAAEADEAEDEEEAEVDVYP